MNFDLALLNDNGDSPYLLEPEAPIVLYSDFPEIIDNTAREQFVNCPQKFFRSTVQKIGPRRTSEHLHFGGAYAAGLEAMRKAYYDEEFSESCATVIGVEAAIKFWGEYEPPADSLKSYSNLILALDNYATCRPLSQDHIKPYRLSSGRSAVEFTFAIPIPGTVHPQTGQPILYAGRFDMLAEFQAALFVEDDKTTSRLGPQWSKQWDLNSQFTGYCWAAREHGLPVSGAIIRGQSILANSNEIQEVITYRPSWQIDRWLNQLRLDVSRMIRAWELDYFDYALGNACSSHGGCEFKKLCTSNRPEDWLKGDYKQKHWNPLAKDPEEQK